MGNFCEHRNPAGQQCANRPVVAQSFCLRHGGVTGLTVAERAVIEAAVRWYEVKLQWQESLGANRRLAAAVAALLREREASGG